MEVSEISSMVSAGAAAIAAGLATYSIYITHNANARKDDIENKKNLSVLLSNLIEVNLALDDVMREPIQKYTDRATISVTRLLRALAGTGAINKYASLPGICEQYLTYTAELQFNDFTSQALTKDIHVFEEKFRYLKHLIAEDLDMFL
jgi:hypothetical protein